MRATLLLAGAVALWPCAALAQHAESKAPPKAELKTDAHVTVQGKAPAAPAPHGAAPKEHQPSIAPVLGQIAPAKPAAPERPAGAKPAVGDHATAAKPGQPAAGEHAAAGKPATPAAAHEMAHDVARDAAPGKHGKPEEPAAAAPQTAKRGKASAGPSVNDVAASINQRLAELAELRRTMPGALRRPVAPKKKDDEGVAGAGGAVASPVAVKPPETPRFRIELQWRVPVMWPDELLTTGMS